MRGSKRGFVTLLQKALDRNLLAFHCILHQEALCAQTFPSECMAVMNLVIEMVNKIIAKALNHRQFRALLDEVDSEYSDLLLHNKVRWLSRGEVLRRLFRTRENIPEKQRPELPATGRYRVARKTALFGRYDKPPKQAE
ncbi:protein FAM200C-like [Oratosquilla oratoria]|uniref:protein FAM200C-like n=1 Tax=Oratosquilla oratoria TaxID=337810 RepID=UPI003F770AF5